MEKAKKMHMIGNAHIDPVWLWRWQEGFQEIKATFRSALDRMEEYPEFRFTCSSTAFLEWIERIDPELFSRLKERIQEGRMELAGGWFIEPDCLLPCGEAFELIGAAYGRRGVFAVGGVAHRHDLDDGAHDALLVGVDDSSGYGAAVCLRRCRNDYER